MHLAARRTTVYVTHDQEEALVMSDRIAIMSQGRIEQVGNPDELYRSPKNVFVATFLGESNLLPLEAVETAGQGTSFRIPGACETWTVGARPPGSASGLVLLVRPEHLAFARSGEPSLAGTVTEIVYLGELTALRIALDAGHEVWMRQMNLSPVRAGEKVRVRWDPMSVRLLETAKETDKTGGKP
jgi:ABC-type Fe3+/spermidine/putrescine transport system ATPase subunit